MQAPGQRILEMAARVGYGARGLVYLMVGGLAALAALGTGGKVTGSTGALRTFLSEPLGWVWLGLVGLGLLFFAVWRILQATTSADFGNASRSKPIWARAVFLLSALVYLGLAWWAVNLALGWSAGRGEGAKGWTAWLMSKPFGPWLVVSVGIGVAVAGLFFYWKAWRADFSESLGSDADEWLESLGKIGQVARGLVFNLIGVFLIVAGLQSDPSEAEGLGGALAKLQQQPYGWILLAVTAIGLAAFGAFNIAEAVYGRIHAPSVEN